MRLSIQLYTVREAMTTDPATTLSALADMGLEYVELAGTAGRTASEFKALLDSTGLRVSGAHVGLDLLERDIDAVIGEAKILGNPWVIVPWIGKDRYQYGWRAFGESLTPISERIQGAGLGFAYHNHDFEMVQEGGETGLEALFSGAGPNVKAELDLGWVHFAGADPAAFIRRFGPRAPLVHLKDMGPDRENPHVAAGDGLIDWTSVLSACKETGVEFGAIEMDIPPGDPIESVRRSVQFFHTLGLR